MPGPGGGSSGGGFGGGSFGGGGGFSGGGGFGGGSFGSGHHGGSFGGGPRHTPPHHGPHFHGPHFGGWGRRRYVGGGGCVSFFLIGLFIMFLVIFFLMPADTVIIGDESVSAVPEDSVLYDEAVMQDYADENYSLYFGDHENYENNILLVFLTNEACDGYYTIAWVGDNIRAEINEMFGEYTEYGHALYNHINQNYYAYSLDTDLTAVVKEMTGNIVSLGLVSSFNSKAANYDDYNKPVSKLVNSTSLEMNKELVDGVLTEFTEETGIPCVIVVDSAERVFGAVTDDDYASDIYVGDQAYEECITILDGDSSDIAIIGGADGPTQVTVGGGVSYVFIIVVVLIALVALGLFLRLKKGNKVTEEKDEEKRKGSSVGKDEKPPWEL